MDPMQIAAQVKAGQPIIINVNGTREDDIQLAPDEVIVQAVPREGLVVAGEAGIVIALDTVLTDDLINEGLAREVIRRINDLRKSSGLDISDRINTVYEASPRLASAVAAFADYVRGETLTVELSEGEPDDGAASDTFDGETLSVSLSKV